MVGKLKFNNSKKKSLFNCAMCEEGIFGDDPMKVALFYFFDTGNCQIRCVLVLVV